MSDKKLALIDDLFPEDDRGSRAMEALMYLASAAADVTLALAGSPITGLGTLASAVAAVENRNKRDAREAFRRVLGHMDEQLESVKREVQAGRIGQDEVNRRFTLLARAFQEAGRHPHRALREAQGCFAARVLVLNLDDITRFEVAEILNRMTALDYAYLVRLATHQQEGTTLAVVLDGKNTVKNLGKAQPGHGRADTPVMVEVLKQEFPGIDFDRVRAVETRLVSFGLLADRIDRKMAYSAPGPEPSWRVAALGLRLVELASAPSDGDPDRPT